MQITKRDGTLEQFDRKKVVQAITKAMRVTEMGVDVGLAESVSILIEEMFSDTTFSVGQVQDEVENLLMDSHRKDVARAYITYRNSRTSEREKNGRLMEFVSDVIDLNNLENENANMPEWVFTAKNVRMSNEVSKRYTQNFLLSSDVKRANKDMDIYIHDESQYAVGSHNCLTLDLADVLSRGFTATNGDVRPPKSIRSAMQLTAVVLQCASNVQFGGIAVGTLDHDLAPYVAMSFRQHFEDGLEYIEGLTEEFISAFMCKGIAVLGSDSEACSFFPEVYEYALAMTQRELDQSAEALIHNLNTLQSRAGDQLPFTSVNFGTDTSIEGRMITKAILDATIKGVGKDRVTPIFPISIFQLREGVNSTKGDPNYDLKKLAIECSSKRIYPNFANTDAPHLAPVTDKTEIFCTMGCRTALGTDRHGVKGYQGRGNISPVTINLTKIGLDNGIALTGAESPNLQGFWKQLDATIDLAIKALVERFEWQGKQLARSAPFLYENQLLKHHRKLQPHEPVREVLMHGTLAIGYLGLSNCLTALFGKDHSDDEGILAFAEAIVSTIDSRAKEASEQFDLNFSAYATPAEGLSHKMAKKLQEQYGIVEGVTDREYITNSHHVPVYKPVTITEKLDIESRFAKYATGGNITYVEIDGNARQNLLAMEGIIDYAVSKGLPYIAINHPIDLCTSCGYEGIIGKECPKCGGRDGEVYIKRLRRVTGYITNSYKEFFNEGKKAETEDRFVHSQHSSLSELE